MIAWLFKQLVQITVRYAIALLVGGVIGSIGHFFIFNALSNSFLANIMILHIFTLMIPSVLVWHLIAQSLTIISLFKGFVEIKVALITVVLALCGFVVLLPELTSAAAIDITLFVSTFTIAAGLCGYIMDRLKAAGIL